MLIILVQIIIITILVRYFHKNGLPKIQLYMVIAGIIQAAIFVIYRIELYSLGREVYFSDAEVYWNTTLDLLNGISSITFNMGYVYYCYLIEITSPFVWAGFINIANTLLIDVTVLILAYIMHKSKINLKNIVAFINITLTNPLIIYSLMRNLKDIVFLFYTSVIILVYYFLQNSTRLRKKVLLYIVIIIFTVLVSDIRPWGFLIPLSIFLYFYAKSIFVNAKTKPTVFIIQLLFGIIMIIALLFLMQKLGYMQQLYMWVPIVLQNAFGMSIVSNILAPFKILTGPGPIRAIFGSRYFVFYTVIGNISAAIGSLVWWFVLGVLSACLVVRKKNFIELSIMLLITFVLFIMIYSLQYGGSLELRFRGIIYILTTALVLSTVEIKATVNSSMFAVIFIMIITAGGIAFGT